MPIDADDGDDLVFATDSGTPYPYMQYEGGSGANPIGADDSKSVRGGSGAERTSSSSSRPKTGGE
jgi:hypothetical protein